MMLKSLSVAFALVFTVVQISAAGSVTLTPTKDNTLIQDTNAASQLSNGAGDIFVGRTAQDGSGPNTTATISIRRGLVEFNPASVPAGATITGVTLTMRDVMGLNGTSTITLHDALQDWGQGTSFQNGGMGAAATNGDATWLYTFFNAANPSASTTWNTPGGSFSSTVSGAAVDSLTAPGLVTWSSATNPQMITDVQNWIANPTSNFGWVILGDESAGQTARRLNSSESTTSPSVPPSLVITYTVPEPSACTLCALAAVAMVVTRATRRRIS
jgi:hypothetical protein